jgi:hypothetical protein
MSWFAVHDFHLLPVIRKFLATLEARNVGPGEGSGRRPSLAPPVRQWETVILVCTAEKHIQKTCHKYHTPGL